MRTTSSVESLNSQIGRSFRIHPSIFKFCESLKQLEFTKATRMKKLLVDCPENQLNRKHRVDQERDIKIKYFSSLFKKGSIDVSMFLEAMANKKVLPLNGKCHKKFSLFFSIDLINISALQNISSTRAVGIRNKSRNIRKHKKKTKKLKASKQTI